MVVFNTEITILGILCLTQALHRTTLCMIMSRLNYNNIPNEQVLRVRGSIRCRVYSRSWRILLAWNTKS